MCASKSSYAAKRMTTAARPLPSMPRSLLLAYGAVIRTECEGVARGAEMIRSAIDSIETDGPVPAVQCWDGLLLVITHAAGLSRMLWPQRLAKKPEKDNQDQAARRRRGSELQVWLDVKPGSPLNEAGRTVRDTIEHWDERVEDLHQDTVGKKIIASAIVQSGRLGPDYYCVRSFDQTTMTVTYGRDSLDLRPLLAEVDRLWNEYSARMVTGGLAAR